MAQTELMQIRAVGFDDRHFWLLAVHPENDALALGCLLPTWHVANGGRSHDSFQAGAVSIQHVEVGAMVPVAGERNALPVRRPAGIPILELGTTRDVEGIASVRVNDEHFRIARSNRGEQQLVARQVARANGRRKA